MFLSWLRQRRRKRILATPFPAEWLAYLEKNVPHYRYLSPAEQAKLRDDLRIFVAEKNWEGCGGLTVTDEMKVTIAAQACLMALGLEGEPFRNVLSILIYPSGYAVPEERWYEGWSIAGESDRLGEAWYRGPVILSWAEVAPRLRAIRARAATWCGTNSPTRSTCSIAAPTARRPWPIATSASAGTT